MAFGTLTWPLYKFLIYKVEILSFMLGLSGLNKAPNIVGALEM